MKKYLLLSAAASMMLMASCSSDVEKVENGVDVTCTFTIDLPKSVDTRTYGDGQGAVNLVYGIYELNTTQGSITKIGNPRTANFEDLKATVDIKLVTGKDYRIVFWAYNPECSAYTVTWPVGTNPTVKVSYDGILQNDETRDAFYNYADVHVTGTLNETVYLYRPFAQINFGTNDAQEDAVVTAFGANLNKLQTKLVTKAYDTLDLITGTVTNQVDVTYGLNGIVPSSEEFPYLPDTYKYLSMDYMLVPADKSMVPVTFSVYSNDATPATLLNTISIDQVPVQRNYQTNIVGQLLTTTGNFEVIIVPGFPNPDYNVTPEGDLIQ